MFELETYLKTYFKNDVESYLTSKRDCDFGAGIACHAGAAKIKNRWLCKGHLGKEVDV